MIHILDSNSDELIGWINAVKSDSHKITIDNEETYEFIVPISEPGASLVDSRSRIIIPGEDGDYREFVVDYTYDRTTSKEKEVYAVGSFLDIRKLKIIKPQVRTKQTARRAAIYILDGLPWEPGNFDWSDTLDWHIETHIDAYEALKQVSSLYKLDLQFRVTTDGSTVTGRYVDFIRRTDINSGKEITFGKDLAGIVRKVYSERLVTALHCVGPDRQDGTRLETLVTNDEAYRNWNWKGKHLVGLYHVSDDNSDGEMTLEQLKKLGEEELFKRITAAIEYEIDAVNLDHILGYEHEEVRLGYMSRVKDEHFNPPMYLDSRVVFVERSIFNKAKKNYKLGEVISYSEEDIMKSWRGLQEKHRMKIIKSPTPPPGNINHLWIKTGNSLDVAHSWDATLDKWVPLYDIVSVGGRNLLRDTRESVTSSSYSIKDYYTTEEIPDGTQVSLSLRGALGSDRTSFSIYNSGDDTLLTTLKPEDKGDDGVFRKTFNWVVDDGEYPYLRVIQEPIDGSDDSTIDWIQLEKGNVSTDWSPSPEDIQSDINDKAATNDLDNLAGIVSDIGSQVDSKTDYTAFREMQDAFNERVAQDILDKEQIIENLSTMEGRTALVESIVGDSKRVTEFVDSVITESEEGIFISNGATSTGILISTDRISFMDKDKEVAYISNQTMQINHGVFVESATISDFKFEKIPGTTIMAITWVGG